MGEKTPLRAAALLHAAALATVLGGCEDPNTGVDPPRNRLFFPSGLLLDPRTPPEQAEGLQRADDAAHYLIVSNGNNDLSFNAGSVMVVDLDAFFERWATQAPDTSADGDAADADYVPYPFCDGPGERCVLGVGAPTSDDFPCRRLGLLPQVVECDERPFVVDSVRVGDFATVMTASTNEPSGVPRLFLPVRGDPSVTFIDIAEPVATPDGRPNPPDLRCGQAVRDGEAEDDARCGDDFRLRHLRNDESLDALAREPFNISLAEGDGYRYGVVTHSSGTNLTLIDLDGLRGDTSRPAIVDTAVVFVPTGQAFRTGGFGIAQRPCGTCVGAGDLGGGNAPNPTQGCTRPLVYASYRFQLSAVSFTVEGIDPADLPFGADTRKSCCGPPQPGFEAPDGEDPQRPIGPVESMTCPDGEVFYGAYCAEPEDIGNDCAVICDPQIRGATRLGVGGVDPLAPTSAAALGDLAFGDRCGEELYAVQTNPGALLKLDTSLNPDNETVDIPAGPPLELCDQPTRIEIWQEADLAFASCFQSAYVYVVDLESWLVVDTVISGTGPHDLVVDTAREVLYVANSLEGSISVIDVGQARPTRYKEVARIGLQEPFRR